MTLDALVIAGGIPEVGDPLYPYTQGEPKALVDICGKPMLQWVLDALCGAENVGNIVVIGIAATSGISCERVSAYLPNQGGMIDNVRRGVEKVLELNPNARHVLLVSSDIPGIRPYMVDWVVNTAMQSDDDVYYNVIERRVMEARYPMSKRSYARLQDVEVCGADMNVMRAALVTKDSEMWERLVATRKNVVKQAALIGFGTMVRLLLHRITLEDAVKRVAKRMNLSGRAILCPYAEVGMDVDKPHQLEILRADLCNQG